MMIPEKSRIEKKDNSGRLTVRRFDDIFESFRKDMEDVFYTPWFHTSAWRFPSLAVNTDVTMPLCDMEDKGNKYEVELDVPGISKEKIDIKATKTYIEISGKQEKRPKIKE